MTIGIIGAMEEEVTLLKESMNVVTTRNVIGCDFFVGSVEGSSHNIVLVRSGIGKVNAALCAQVLIDIFAVDSVINVGVAGAIDRTLKVGDIVISSDAIQHDFDTSALGDEPGYISRMDTSIFAADINLIDAATDAVEELGLVPNIGRIASGDQFIADLDSKHRIQTLFNPLCCEMEGAAIAQVCYFNHIPFLIVRAISDKADDSASMDYPTFEAQAIRHSVNLMAEMLRCF
jgi:adenosylhomocysteine nucleosidase